MSRLLDSIWYGSPRRRLAEALLRPLEALFLLAAALRRWLYSSGLKNSVELPVPVVVVGNVTVGGTGKTPLLIWLAARLVERGYAPGIVSRGYGGKSAAWPRVVAPDSDPREVGDEPVLLAQRTGCPVAVGPDRVRAAESLLAPGAPPVDVLLSDDGLQHYRLARTVEIAVVDGRRGLGNGLCLPAGPLREPPARLEQVDAVVVNGAGWERVGALRADVEPTGVYRVGAPLERRELADFAGSTVHAVAGIGHPERFFEMLERFGLTVVPHPLPDHAEIGPADLEHGASPVLVTEKDAVKCRSIERPDVWSVAIELALRPAAADVLLGRVLQRLPPPGSRGPR